MEIGHEVRYVHYEEFQQKAQEKKIIYRIPHAELIEGIANGKTTYFITVHYHNSSGANIEVQPEAWKEIIKRIKDRDDDSLWQLLNSWGIYRR
ncbi:hypothetical protein P2R12_20665 [Cytobacillus oceanisediminis]|uniref:hypothetical protein n=1 Tax=Cytobacillus oceanisediminis TaxID=665099 RepID=UPI0023DB6BD4|nr:hypothetical protein [Cytobacillus oceanisediminis]MDF2039349.1 hypothetical protein [Cytobacillus oceanisediminis]